MEFEQALAPKSSQPHQADATSPKPKANGLITAKRLDRRTQKDENGKVVSVQVRLSRGKTDGVVVGDEKHSATRGYIDKLQGKADFTVIWADDYTCWVHFDTTQNVPEQYAERSVDYILIIK